MIRIGWTERSYYRKNKYRQRASDRSDRDFGTARGNSLLRISIITPSKLVVFPDPRRVNSCCPLKAVLKNTLASIAPLLVNQSNLYSATALVIFSFVFPDIEPLVLIVMRSPNHLCWFKIFSKAFLLTPGSTRVYASPKGTKKRHMPYNNGICLFFS